MTDAEPQPTDLPPERVAELLGEGAELIDVRRSYEWEGGRIAGARNIEMNELKAQADSIPRDRPVVFYCRGDNRSEMATAAFRAAGYDAYNLEGGIDAWAAAGRPLEPEEAEVRAPMPPSAEA